MRGMRAAAVIAGAVLVAASLSGCASEQTPPAATPKVEQPLDAEPASARTAGLGDAYYLATVKSLLSDVEHVTQPDADYIRGGKAICQQIDDGATWQTFADQIEETGLDYNRSRSVVGAAIISFCPQHASIIG